MYPVMYARVGEQHVAYQQFGHGEVRLIVAPPVISNLEINWEDPRYARFLERLGSFARVVLFDKRATGLSDPIPRPPGVPALEERMDDITAVMDAVGWEDAALFGYAEGGPLCILYAATHPERVTSLILANAAARLIRAPDYEWGWEPTNTPMAESSSTWGSTEVVEPFLHKFAPGLVGAPDWKDFVRFHARWQRLGASPGIFAAMQRVAAEIDVRDVLPAVRCNALVLHRAENQILDVRHGRYLAEHLPSARYRELPGADHYPFLSDADAILNEVQEFLTGAPAEVEHDRVLATMLFTDIVGSTKTAATLGDAGWKQLLAQHNDVVRRELARYRGREVTTTGDGFLATFDGPARGVKAAVGIRDSLRDIGVEVRAGLHTGECELIGDNIGGVAVHIGARVGALAGAGEILVSSTVKDLVAGSGIAFEDRGTHELKGVPDSWRIYAVAN
jgi:pimeloyl-ACP methyl ester carboxylesterase